LYNCKESRATADFTLQAARFSDEDYIVSPFIKDDPIFAEYINKQLGICKTNLEKTKNAEDKSFSAQFEYLISIYEKFI